MAKSAKPADAMPAPATTEIATVPPQEASNVSIVTHDANQPAPLALPPEWGFGERDNRALVTWDITTEQGLMRLEAHILDADENAMDWINREIAIVAISVRPIEFTKETGEVERTLRVVIEDTDGNLIRMNSVYAYQCIAARLATHMASGQLAAHRPMTLLLERRPSTDNKSFYFLSRPKLKSAKA